MGEEKVQKRFYEKWWFWLMAVFFVSVVITSQEEGEQIEQVSVQEMDEPIKAKAEDVLVKEKSNPATDTTSDSGTYKNPIAELDSDKVKAEIMEKAKTKWPEDYVMQEHLLQQETESFNNLSKLTIDSKVKEDILNKVIQDWPDDYHMMEFLYKEHLEAYDFVEAIQPANDVEVKVLEQAKKDWPNDYKMIAFTYKEQLDAYDYLMGIQPADEDEKRILENAFKEWPNDYVMVKYDYEEQLKAKKNLEKSQ